ncbi:YesL family protein [Isoptericola variabilis]|uniref:Uncharacterized protein n=1 Tax=Isoptericola variabilis (strain 225) TaxID=743718 RepID=F6FX80_ISOV2|nr:DUF624 domain-containing protein [Isoptericola variabilis]AEG43583.1 protein of unknown function DUF624 [Isoptericola variabilis 225]TWH32049.1 putative membrane protein YesL [Isoptericola variabilis J7]
MTDARDRDLRADARRRVADAEVPGWAGGVMLGLRWVTLLVELNLMVLLGTLAGGVVLGLGPSLRAGSAVAAAMTADPTPWRTFWRTWRRGFGRANLLFAPVWAAAILLWFDGVAVTLLEGPARAALHVGLVAVAVWGAVVLAYWPRVTQRYDRGAGATWRFLLLVPLLGPTTSLAVLVVLGATALAVWALPALVVLVGASFPLWATGRLVDDRLDRIDARAS